MIGSFQSRVKSSLMETQQSMYSYIIEVLQILCDFYIEDYKFDFYLTDEERPTNNYGLKFELKQFCDHPCENFFLYDIF